VGTGELSTSKFKYETLQVSKDLIKFSECQVPLRKFKPLIQDLLAMVLVFTSHLFTRQISCVRFLPVCKSKKNVNRESNSYNHLGAFYLTCFARVCEIFTAVVSSGDCRI